MFRISHDPHDHRWCIPAPLCPPPWLNSPLETECLTEESEEPRSTLYQFQPILSSRSRRCNNFPKVLQLLGAHLTHWVSHGLLSQVGISGFSFLVGVSKVLFLLYVRMPFLGVKVPYQDASNRDSAPLFCWVVKNCTWRMIEMYFWVPLIGTWWDSGTPEYLPLVTCPFDLHTEGSATALLLVKQHAYQMDCFILRN